VEDAVPAGAASAPPSAQAEPEPVEWQPRVIWVTGRLLCGAIAFFFASFVFAFFYLKALDLNHNWMIGPDVPAKGLGISIMALYVTGAVIYRLAAKRQEVDELAAGAIAVLFTLAAVALQFFEYTVLGFGAANGGYASVFYGWTATYAVVALMGIYWIWIQTASLLRVRREGTREIEIPAGEEHLIRVGVEAASFYWVFFAVIGFLAWILLYYVR
jgi:heme/copper-type cytochrome/quinol oxidase subunit 3